MPACAPSHHDPVKKQPNTSPKRSVVRGVQFAKSAAVLMGGKLYMFDTLEEAKQLYDYETQG